MRLLFVSTYDRPEFQRKVDLIADYPDIDLHYIVPDQAGIPKGRRRSANGKRCYMVQPLPLCQLGQAGDPHRLYYRTLDFGIRAFKPHIIHCEHEQEGLLAAQVATARNLFAPQTPLIMYSWQNLLRKRSLPIIAICRYTLRNAQHITCASHEAVEVLHKQGYTGTSNVAPMIGIDPAIFYPYSPVAIQNIRAQLGFSESDFVIGFIGRLSVEKSIDTLLHAIAKMHTPCVALIAGNGELEPALKKLATELQIIDRCHFIGAQPNHKIADLMNALNVLVLPSKTMPYWKEQFGRVLAEAMLCKQVVVGSDSGAIPDVIGQPECIFAEQDITALVNSLDKLAQDAILRAQLAQIGYQRAITSFTLAQIAQQNIKCWLDLRLRYHE